MQQKIYISYSHNGDGKAIAEAIDQSFQARGVEIQRDVNHVKYGDSISKFMDEMGEAAHIIAVLDKHYFQSRFCMYELMSIYKNEQFRKRIFPVVLPDAGIYDPLQRIKYLKHWEDKIKELDEAMRTVSLAHQKGIREELDIYDEVRRFSSEIATVLNDMNAQSLEAHQANNFQTIFDAIYAIRQNEGTRTKKPSYPPSSNPTNIDIDRLKSVIRELIANNRIEEAILKLTDIVIQNRSNLVPTVSGIGRRYKDVKRREMTGVLTYDEVSRETNKIVMSIFGALDDL